MRGAPGDEVGGAWNDGSWFHPTGIGKTRLWLQRKVRRSGIVGNRGNRIVGISHDTEQPDRPEHQHNHADCCNARCQIASW